LLGSDAETARTCIAENLQNAGKANMQYQENEVHINFTVKYRNKIRFYGPLLVKINVDFIRHIFASSFI
jgi:hypothetical protein